MKILQWNCRSCRANYSELITKIRHSIHCICLQETQLGNTVQRPPHGYSIHCTSPDNNPVPGTGLAILIQKSFSYLDIPLLPPLQVHACRTGRENTCTICILYVKRNDHLSIADINDLILQLSPPFIIVGDFNWCHTLWRSDTVDT